MWMAFLGAQSYWCVTSWGEERELGEGMGRDGGGCQAIHLTLQKEREGGRPCFESPRPCSFRCLPFLHVRVIRRDY